MYRLFIFLSVDGHLDYFYVLSIVNSPAKNIGVHVSFWITVLSISTPRSGSVGLCGSSIFSFLKNLHAVFHSVCTRLHSYPHCIALYSCPFSLQPLQYLLLVDVLMVVILTGVRWCFVVVLICISLIIGNVEHLCMCLSGLAVCVTVAIGGGVVQRVGPCPWSLSPIVLTVEDRSSRGWPHGNALLAWDGC